MANYNDIFSVKSEVDNIYLRINELFKLNIDKELKEVGYRFKLFYKVHDLIENEQFYIAHIEDSSLIFVDRKTLVEELVKFFEQDS